MILLLEGLGLQWISYNFNMGLVFRLITQWKLTCQNVFCAINDKSSKCVCVRSVASSQNVSVCGKGLSSATDHGLKRKEKKNYQKRWHPEHGEF